jgi:hypothetical protein
MEIDQGLEPSNSNRTEDLIETRYNSIVIRLNQPVKRWVINIFDNLETQMELAGKVTASLPFSPQQSWKTEEILSLPLAPFPFG